jgi:potassium channel subfamily K, other eukaryote
VLALTANLSLLLNMARRVSFAIAQPVTIVGFFLAALLLIALVAVASTSVFRLEPTSQHALSQAFYYGIIAAGLYCIISFLMVLTVYGAIRGHYDKEFRLTMPQRTLMLQTISFMVYVLLGALIFSKIEGWHYLDGVYWADVTLFTVGLGDYSLNTHLGRSLFFPYAIGGIVMVGLVIGSIRSLVLERGKHKLTARFTEKRREKVLGSVNPDKRTIKMGMFKRTVTFSQPGLSEPRRREEEFNIMRKVQKDAENIRQWASLGISVIAAFTLWLVGAVVFWRAERDHQQWTYFTALYFSYTSLLTIGYGDITPLSNAGKAFFVFWSLLAVPTLTILISNMGDTVVKAFSDFTIWLGSLTVLPDEEGARAAIKYAAKQTRARLFKDDNNVHAMKPPGFSTAQDEKGASNQHRTIEDAAIDRISSLLEAEEFDEAERAGERGDTLERDIHFYHMILAKEVRKLMKDVNASPPKEYSYAEWAYYLKLIGEDEADPQRHRKPPIKAKRTQNGTPNLGSAGLQDEDGNPHAWSWLGTRSPLMGSKSEAEWLLQRLSATLEGELRKFRIPNEKREPPPISMDDLKRGRSRKSQTDAQTKDEMDLGEGFPSSQLRRRVSE